MVIPNKAGHFPNFEIPEAFNSALIAFLDGLPDYTVASERNRHSKKLPARVIHLYGRCVHSRRGR